MKGPALAAWVVAAAVPLSGAAWAETLSEAQAQGLRRAMVERQITARGIQNVRVLEAMGSVERHLFVPPDMTALAYADSPLPIGHEQTISQPYIVALMTELADPKPGERALEIGTGSGYQAAVLAHMGVDVYSMEIVGPLAEESGRRLKQLGYFNVRVRHGDGYQGWPEHAPYDVVLVTAAPPQVPQALVDQLAVGGRMVVPVGEGEQELLLITKSEQGIAERKIIPVRFVPMVKGNERKPAS